MRRMFALTVLFAILAAFLPANVFAAPQNILITEIMYDFAGSDTGHEWVELWNGGSETVTIIGGSGAGSWRFNDGANHTFFNTPARGSLTLAPGDFLIISSNTDTFLTDHPEFSGNLVKVSFSLGNTNETLSLRIETNGTPWSEVSYASTQGANGNGKTLEWNRETSAWSESANVGGSQGNFGTPNSVPPPPESPPAPEPNQPTANSQQPVVDNTQPTANSAQPSYDLTADLKISEFLPDPIGSDMEEWIEIYNSMNRLADLSGWRLDDNEGGSNPYQFPDGAQIQPDAYEIFPRRLTILQLNNDLDSVRLIRPDGAIKDEVAYGDAPEGSSYAKDGIVWKWAASPTQGAENIFLRPTANSLQPTVGSEKKEAAMEKQESGITNQELPKKQTKSANKNQKFIFEGAVTVLPGVFGTQYFYAQNEKRGLQIYMNKKDFPMMDIGTKIRATGVIGVAYGEDRLKLSSKDDITILGEEKISPEEMAFDSLDDSKIGKLVFVSGEVVNNDKSGFTLAFGDSEFEIVWKKGAGDMPDIFPGDAIKIAGIVQKNKNGFKILPRGVEDIEIIKKAENIVVKKENKERGLNPLVYVFAPLFAAGMAMGIKRLGRKREADGGEGSQLT